MSNRLHGVEDSNDAESSDGSAVLSQRKRRRSNSTASADDRHETYSSDSDVARPLKRIKSSGSQSYSGSESDLSSSSDDEDAILPPPDESYVREPTALLTIRDAAAAKSAAPKQKAAGSTHAARLANRKRRGGGVPKFNEPYLDMLNASIKDARSARVYSFKGFKEMEDSTVLGSVWTVREKEAFFGALPRVGRDDFGRLAQAVGSKSPVECAAYVHELRKASEKLRESQEMRLSQTRPITAADIPAAVEVSNACVEALDAEAERLEKFRVEEELRDIRKAKTWEEGYEVLDEEIAEDFSAALEEDVGKLKAVSPGAELLNLEVFLGLADKFYNFESTSMRHQAFSDLYTLAVSLTRRLIQVTLFQANTRLRAQSTPQDVSKVDIVDVATAVRILGIAGSSEDFWRYFARRNNIQVRFYHKFQDPATGKKKHVRRGISHDVVEEMLQIHEDIHFEPTIEVDEDSSDEEEQIDDIYDPRPYLKEYPDHFIFARKRKQVVKTLSRAKTEDEYLDSIDTKASLKEELQLWEILGATSDVLEDVRGRFGKVKDLARPPIYPKWWREEAEAEDWRENMVDRRLWEEEFYGDLWAEEGFGDRVRMRAKKIEADYTSSESEGGSSESDGVSRESVDLTLPRRSVRPPRDSIQNRFVSTVAYVDASEDDFVVSDESDVYTDSDG